MSAEADTTKHSSNNGANGKAKLAEPTVVTISGALERGIDQIDKTLASGVDMIIDFSDCTFVSVDGLEWLEELMLRATSLQSTVRMVKMRPTVYKVFKVAHIQSLLKACDSPVPRGPVC